MFNVILCCGLLTLIAIPRFAWAKEKAYQYDHTNLGCPENSDCTVEQGAERARWLDLADEAKALSSDKATARIRHFHETAGLPVTFYSISKDMAFMSWDSPCSLHRPPKAKDTVKEVMGLVHDTEQGKMHVWVKGKMTTRPIDQDDVMDPLIVSKENGKALKRFYMPRGERPVFMNGDDAVLIREENGLYYGLRVRASGEWEVVSLDAAVVARAKLAKEDVDCPASVKAWPTDSSLRDRYARVYQSGHCLKIWNQATQSTDIMKWYLSCP